VASELDFYATLAQILPVLLLTLVWDRAYLDELRTRTSTDVVFWTPSRVRWYSLALTAVLVLAVVVCLCVLAGVVIDGWLLRGVLIVVAGLGLMTLVVRVGAGVLRATAPPPPGP
jgi:hypothetical protein